LRPQTFKFNSFVYALKYCVFHPIQTLL
jgi:hypothetical protein